MSALNAVVGALNWVFLPKVGGELPDPERFAPGTDLATSVLELVPPEVAIDPDRFGTITEGFAPAITEALRALIFENLTRAEGPAFMSFSWAPGYESELRVWESRHSADRPGTITVQVRTRHPNDPRPAPDGGTG